MIGLRQLLKFFFLFFKSQYKTKKDFQTKVARSFSLNFTSRQDTKNSYRVIKKNKKRRHFKNCILRSIFICIKTVTNSGSSLH